MAIEKDDKKPNILVLREFRLDGKAVKKGSVISKKEFANNGDWLNLCAMKPARAEQTDEKVGSAPAPASKRGAKLPGAE